MGAAEPASIAENPDHDVQAEIGADEPGEVEAEEVLVPEAPVDAPRPSRTRKLPARLVDMVDERGNLKKGRYQHKTVPVEPVDVPVLEEEEEHDSQAQARPARVPQVQLSSF